jgi:hypothetical protein
MDRRSLIGLGLAGLAAPGLLARRLEASEGGFRVTYFDRKSAARAT